MNGRSPMNHARRHRLAMLAEAIIPASGGMPSASAVGLVDEGGPVDRALVLRPDLAAALGTILDSLAGVPDAKACLLHAERDAPGALLTLMEVIAGAYYLVPEVQALTGYSGQEAIGLGRGEIGAEDLLEKMMQRPPRWRPVTERAR